MPGWGEIFADPVMQGREPEPELMALIPVMQGGGLPPGPGRGLRRRAVTCCPCSPPGFEVWGVDCDAQVLRLLEDPPE